MLYGNYCYIFIENFSQKFSPCRKNSYNLPPEKYLCAKYLKYITHILHIYLTKSCIIRIYIFFQCGLLSENIHANIDHALEHLSYRIRPFFKYPVTKVSKRKALYKLSIQMPILLQNIEKDTLLFGYAGVN